MKLLTKIKSCFETDWMNYKDAKQEYKLQQSSQDKKVFRNQCYKAFCNLVSCYTFRCKLSNVCNSVNVFTEQMLEYKKQQEIVNKTRNDYLSACADDTCFNIRCAYRTLDCKNVKCPAFIDHQDAHNKWKIYDAAVKTRNELNMGRVAECMAIFMYGI